jgi:hypothetical protein
MRVGDERQFGWLQGVIAALLFLNLLDAIFTLLWVRLGLAREANELLRHLVEEHALLFVAVKIALVSLGSALLWHRRHNPAAVVAIFGAFLVYYAVLLYHLRFASWLMTRG